MTRHPLVDPLRTEVLRAIYRQGVRAAVAERALQKWEAGQPAAPCIEEQKGKPYGVESSGSTPCPCLGCIERRCFAYFQQVTKRLSG